MSCTTRRQKKRSLDQTDHNQELPLSLGKCKEKKRRRSSFMRGRNQRSLPPANLDVSELHKKIPPDETEEKRLALLQQVSFEYTMNRLEEEMPHVRGFEELKNKARSAFNETLDKLEKDNCLRESCSMQKNLPNPINVKMEESATMIQEHCNGLVEESNKWEELLTSATDAATQAEERRLQKGTDSKAPDTLSKQDKRYLAELPDLNQILSSTKNSLQELEMHVDTILQTSKGLKELEANTDLYLTQQIKLIGKTSSRLASIVVKFLNTASRVFHS
ncbi:uncharacterized protein [Antedon mediterranea]|uniref:uncharacterized protein isoform X2 n=1 Tax=Antedon mediterranea TaxID=105859 RepID=UPI003AF8CF60